MTALHLDLEEWIILKDLVLLAREVPTHHRSPTSHLSIQGTDTLHIHPPVKDYSQETPLKVEVT